LSVQGLLIGRVKLATDNGPLTTDHWLITYFYRIDYADYRCIDRAVFALERHSRGTSLYDEHDLIHAGAYGIDGDQMTFLILAFDIDHPRDEKLAPMKAIIFARGNDCSDYSCKKHVGPLSVVSCQLYLVRVSWSSPGVTYNGQRTTDN
jgi:hypothetical protein